jgi:hypothetical protein
VHSNVTPPPNGYLKPVNVKEKCALTSNFARAETADRVVFLESSVVVAKRAYPHDGLRLGGVDGEESIVLHTASSGCNAPKFRRYGAVGEAVAHYMHLDWSARGRGKRFGSAIFRNSAVQVLVISFLFIK